MKTLAILLVACVIGVYSATLTDEQKAKLRGYKETCIAENGVDPAVVDAIIKGGPITPEAKLNCFAACMLKKIGVMRADGTIDEEAARARAATTKVDMNKANEVINKCKGLTGSDACETGGKVFGCFIQNKDFPVLD